MNAQPGWYPDANGVMRFWNGYEWTNSTAAPTAPVLQSPHYVSGLTTGQNIIHLILTIFTCGLWGIVWYSKAKLGRRRIS